MPKFRIRILSAALCALAVLSLAGCGDVHGSAGGGGSERGSTEHVRIGWPF